MITASDFPKGRMLVQSRKKNSWITRWFAWILFVACVFAGAAAYWLQRPLDFVAQKTAPLDLRITAGSSGFQIAQQIHAAGVLTPDWWLFGWLRLSGQAKLIKAGSYEISAGMTPPELLGRLVRGEQALRRVTLVEGWHYRQVLQALQQAPDLVWDLPPDASTQPLKLMAMLQLTGHPEGRFFPDTYLYPKREKASVVLVQAAQAMQRTLERVWAERASNLPIKTPQEALILASIIEKETASHADRGLVAAVFTNRLRIGMRLQTDPTVIYGLDNGLDGRLKRMHLTADNPYNTYTRAGLPPTPIAMPGLAALKAAVHPSNSEALYFVARGDGSSEFSVSLDEHNRAVRRYILER